jgi:SAM-dependent methyltransferase
MRRSTRSSSSARRHPSGSEHRVLSISPPQLSIVITALDHAADLPAYLRAVSDAARRLDTSFEIIVAVAPALATLAVVDGASLVAGGEPYFGTVLRTGLAAARGEWVLTLDPDLADPGAIVDRLWRERAEADVTIASRYVAGGSATLPAARRRLSRVLNRVFSRGLSLRVADMSSAVRLYRAASLPRRVEARGFDVLQEILVRVYAEGWSVREIAFAYAPVAPTSAWDRMAHVGSDYARTFWALWKLRNSILAADYDDRAHDSAIPLQRYWQRQRFRHITELIAGQGAVLDVGCGSSRIIGALPKGSVGIDVLRRKLRYARRFRVPLVHGSGFTLPMPDESFPCVLCSQVIEHVPKESPILGELVRTLAPGGRLVLGTPDYARVEWVVTEKLYGFFAPGGYADEHIAHYTREELIAHFTGMGWTHEATRYILRGELILAFRKPR